MAYSIREGSPDRRTRDHAPSRQAPQKLRWNPRGSVVVGRVELVGAHAILALGRVIDAQALPWFEMALVDQPVLEDPADHLGPARARRGARREIGVESSQKILPEARRQLRRTRRRTLALVLVRSWHGDVLVTQPPEKSGIGMPARRQLIGGPAPALAIDVLERRLQPFDADARPLLRDAGIAENKPLRRRRVAVLGGQPGEVDVVAQRRRRDA